MIVGILGAGRAGMRHIGNAKALGHEVMIHDPQVALVRDRNWDRDDVLDNADIVISATPTEQHLIDLEDALSHHVSILVEKPIASIGQSAHLAKALSFAADKHIKVATGFNLRFHPQTAILKAIDAPYFVSAICAQHTDRQADGVLNHWASHEIDLVQYLLGPVRRIDSHITSLTADLYLLDWVDDARAAIHSDMWARKPVRRTLVIGREGSYQADYEACPVSDTDYKKMLEAFIWTVEHNDDDPMLATGWDGHDVLKICEQASALNVQRDK